MKKILTILMLLSVFLLVVACSEPTREMPVTEPTNVAVPDTSVATPTGVVHQVVLENFQFMPTDLTIKAGDTVEWVNKDDVTHTVTFENGDFDQELSEGAMTTYTFLQKGEIRYFCRPHSGMQGSVIVE